MSINVRGGLVTYTVSPVGAVCVFTPNLPVAVPFK